MSTTTERKTVFKPKEEIAYAKNSVVSQQIIKNKAGNISLFAFDKDEQLSEHSAPFEAIVQVLDGTAEIKIAGVPHEVQASEMIVLPANIPHALYATEAFKMLLTMIKG